MLDAKIKEAFDIAIACGSPVQTCLYDEEGIEGWRWNHPDGREWSEVGDHDTIPTMHPVLTDLYLVHFDKGIKIRLRVV